MGRLAKATPSVVVAEQGRATATGPAKGWEAAATESRGLARPCLGTERGSEGLAGPVWAGGRMALARWRAGRLAVGMGALGHRRAMAWGWNGLAIVWNGKATSWVAWAWGGIGAGCPGAGWCGQGLAGYGEARARGCKGRRRIAQARLWLAEIARGRQGNALAVQGNGPGRPRNESAHERQRERVGNGVVSNGAGPWAGGRRWTGSGEAKASGE